MAPPRKEGTPLERTPKPRFNLGGQVSSHVSASTSNLAPTSGIYSEDPPLLPRSRSIWDASSELGGTHSGSHLPRASSLHDTMIPEEDFPHEFDLNNTKSLNPELLMREFTHDELGETNSPSSMFKSSFAKQVVHNVRKSMGSLQPTLEPIRPGLDSPVVEVRSRRSKSSHERRYSSYNPTSSSLRSHVKIDDSDSDKDTLSGNLRP
ncbi:hypothetical protein TCAL_16907 [Tigriopus californicus]|uniref:Uncharacterized protein n=1 Tax=Tigriopus californicus TaxID=6832 RepID=A0A553P8C7_TIGCA|nr:hypothetical protein TCAL_16907 [Tigriopus californicus]